MTKAGYVLLPVCLLLILLPWRFSLTALVPMAIFGDAAVVNIGTFGLQPGYVLALLVVGRTLGELLLLSAPLNAKVLRDLGPLLLFAALSFISLWMGLAFFQGRVMVLFGTAGFDLDQVQPYVLNRQSFTQVFYIGVNTALAYALAHQCVRQPSTIAAAVVKNSFVIAVVLASSITVWEQLAYYLAFDFPYDFFHSNAGSGPAFGQTFGTVLRPSGPFSESSGLAYFFSGAVFYSWQRYRDSCQVSASFLLLLSASLLLMSTSSTAYVTLVIFAVIVAVHIMLKMFGPALGQPVRLRREHAVTVVVLLAVSIAISFYVHSFAEAVNEVMRAAIFEKNATSSFEQRTGADLMAIEIALQTGGVGLGLGAHKANNLFTTLIASSGVIGTAVFLFFIFTTLQAPRASTAIATTSFREVRAFALGILLVHAISAPGLNSLFLFCAFGFCIGMKALPTGETEPAPVDTEPALGRVYTPALRLPQ